MWKGGSLSIHEAVFRSGVYLGSRNPQWNAYYGFYMTQRFLKDRLTLTVSGSNPFRGDMVHKSRGETPTYVSYSEFRRKSISNDDSVSGGNGGASGASGGATAGAGGAM